jgi:hypothetical protein
MVNFGPGRHPDPQPTENPEQRWPVQPEQHRPFIQELGEGAAIMLENVANKRNAFAKTMRAADKAAKQQEAAMRALGMNRYGKPLPIAGEAADAAAAVAGVAEEGAVLLQAPAPVPPFDEEAAERAARKLRRLRSDKAKAKRGFGQQKQRLADMQKDLHVRMGANTLSRCDRFGLPLWNVHNMIGAGSKLRRRTKRQALSLGHAKFRHYIKHRALVEGKEVWTILEHYTTQICPCCGGLNKDIGGNRWFKCPMVACEGYE